MNIHGQPPDDPPVLDTGELRAAIRGELEGRRFAAEPGCFADRRGGGEALYGLTGAANIHAALGLPLGGRPEREGWARRILAHADEAGHFEGGSGPGHALHMVVAALNILGEPVPSGIGPLAPENAAELPAWLDRQDWGSTHKEFCGQTIPLLASGRVSAEWTDVLVREVGGRLDPARPLKTWCRPDAPAWRVISCVFHVLSAFDAGALPYPQPELLLGRFLDLGWEDAPDEEKRTVCTDGDWAWVLLRLRDQLPEQSERIVAAVRKVSARRVRAWHSDPEAVLSLRTHDLYCYLWSSAVFRSCARDHYRGGAVKDTLNEPALYRL
jgi:hypothetical protein